MALRVWLPLNGSAKNIGISGNDGTVMGTGITYTDGKIGQAATFPNNCNSCIHIPGLKLQILSWCCWFYCSGAGSGTSQRILSEGRDTGSVGTNIWLSKEGTTLNWSTHKKTGATAVTLNTWYHVALICDASNIYLYLNGVLQSTTAYTEASDYAQSADKFVLGKMSYSYTNTSNYFPFNGKLNDVRIYDNALSALEVKEIAQGLILHYKLDNPYIESTTNINSYIQQGIDNTCYNGSKNTYNYGTTTDIYKETGFFQGKSCTKVHMGTAGAAAWPYVHFTPMHPANGAYKTLSFDYFPTSITQINFYTHGGTATLTSTVNGQAVNAATMTVLLNQWNHITVTLLGTSDSTSGWGYMRIGSGSHTSTTTDYWLFANVQIENTDHETPYSNNSSTRNGILVADSSGYGHDGTVQGATTTPIGTTRYNTSMIFNGTNTCISLKDFYVGNEWSYGCWINTPTSTTRGWEAVILFNNTGSDADSQLAFWVHQQENRFESLANTKYTSTISYTNYYGNWHHFFATYNGNVLTTYIDGTVVNTKTITDDRYNATHLTIGARCTNATVTSFANWFEGQLSDVRVYVTPLSTEDVLTLYHTPTHIDNLGKLHGFELDETDTINLSDFTLASTNWVSDGVTATYTTTDMGPSVQIVPSSGSRRIYHNVSNVWINGTTYIVSFIAKCSANGGTIVASRSLVDNSPTFTLTTDWQQYYGLITSTATPGGGTLSLTCSGTNTYYITNVKLELADQNLIQIFENGVTKSNWIDEHDPNIYASFLKNSSVILANDFLEK